MTDKKRIKIQKIEKNKQRNEGTTLGKWGRLNMDFQLVLFCCVIFRVAHFQLFYKWFTP